ncbi:hypothetical protein JCM11251_001268 [Rhodosporidiobolus azoricus]
MSSHTSTTNERTALLHEAVPRPDGAEQRAGRKASPSWIIPASFIFALFEGATVAVDMELLQLACLAVGQHDPASPPSVTLLHSGFQLGSDEKWAEGCRALPEVQTSTTEIVTTAALLGGILAALTAAWWGSFADRKGRKPVLAIVSLGEILTSVVMILLITFPTVFGYRFYLAGALVSGLLSGALTDFVTGAAYLSDCTDEGSKTRILSLYEAALFLGTGIGPILASSIISISGLGIKAPYVGLVIARVIYLCTFPFMPESLPAQQRKQAAKKDEVPKPFLARLLSLPAELLSPLAVLLPKKKDGKREWQLTLLAISLALFMILPGLSTIKVLYARSRFNWGPEDIGQWTSFSSLCKLVVLVGALPLANRFFRKVPAPSTTKQETEERKKVADCCKFPLISPNVPGYVDWSSHAAFDLDLARRSILCAFFGYVAMSFSAGDSPRNFLIGTLLTSFAAATPPALQSLALASCAPEDAGKVLASITALATISTAMVGPAFFGAVYVAVVKSWPEFIFVIAAAWMFCSYIPLWLVRLPRRSADTEEEDV